MPHGAIPFPFGDCRICNDKATGIHYGVATCEGCKGFFKRSLSKADRYKCFFGGQCKLSPQNRNRCKSCRFQRCLAMGMSVEAVKMGRIPKVDKERALEMTRYGDGQGAQNLPEGAWPGDMAPPHLPSLPSSTTALSNHSSHHQPLTSVPSPPSLQQMTHRIAQSVMQEKTGGHDPMAMPGRSGQLPYYPQNTPASYPSQYPDSYHGNSSTAGPLTSPSYSDSHKVAVDVTGASPHGRYLNHRVSNSSHHQMWDAAHGGQAHPVDPAHHHQGLRVGGVPEYPYDSARKSEIAKPIYSHSGSDSGVSDMTNSDQSLMEVDGASQSPQGQARTSAGSVLARLRTESVESRGKSLEVFSPAIIDNLITQVIEQSQEEQNTYNQSMEMDTSDELGNTFTDVMIKEEIPDPSFPDPNLDLPVFTDDLVDQQMPCDLSQQEPSSSTEKDLDLSSMVCRENLQRSTSPSGDSDCIGSSMDEDPSYLLAKSYKIVEKLYNEKFSLQQSWIPQAYDIISGNAKRHPLNEIYECTKEEAAKVWQNLFASIVPWNTRILGFCSEIPGFTQLNKDDQGYLLKAGYYDLWMLAVVCAYIDDDSYYFMENGMYYSRWWMLHFLPLKFVLMMTRFWTEVSLLNLKPVEIGLLMAIRLVNPDREEVKQPELAQVLQEHYINVLMHSLQQNHGTNSTQLWVKIMRILPSLDDINRTQDEVVGNFQVDAPPDEWGDNLRQLEEMGGDTKTLDFSPILKIRTTGPKNTVKLSNLLST